ncbi:408_t:CDS:2, partial [Scutellospora calospora]
QYPYNTEIYLQFDDDILQFWKYIKGYSKELHKSKKKSAEGYRMNASHESNKFQEEFENYEEFRGFENYEEFRGFENYEEFECNEESNHEENDNFSESRTYCNVLSGEDTDIDVDDKADDQVNSVDLWRCLVEQWLSLIEDEDNADDDSILNEETNL